MDFSDIRDEDEAEVLARRPGCLRGLLRLALFLLAPLALVLALVPTLLSSDPAREWALRKVNAAMAPAEVSVRRWTLGWVRAPVLEAVAFKDAARGVDLSAEQVTSDRGLLRLLPVGRLNLGRVTLKKPVASVSLLTPAEAEAPAAGAKPAGGGGFWLPVVDVAAAVQVENGVLNVKGRAPEPFVAEAVDGSVTLASVRAPIAVRAGMRVGGGTLALEGRVQSLQELFRQAASFDEPERLTLSMGAVDLPAFAPLVQHACGEPWLRGGSADGTLTAVVSGPRQVTLTCGLIVNGLSLGAGRQAPSPPGDCAVKADVEVNGRTVAVRAFEMKSPWLRADARGTLQPGARSGTLTGAVRAQADVDLAAVARDFAAPLGLAPGFTLRQGRLQARVGVEAGDASVKVDADVTTADLTMAVDGRPLTLKPAPALTFKAAFPYGAWPEVETCHLKAPFADVYASGRFDAAVVKARLDLTRLARDLRPVLKECPPMVGSVYADLSSKRQGDAVALGALVKLADVAAELRPGQRLVVPQGALKAEGRVPLNGNRPARELRDAAFELTLERGSLSGGWERLAAAPADGSLVLRGFRLAGDLELGSVRRLLGGFLPAGAQRRMSDWKGRVVANATAEAAGGAVKARFNAAGQQVEAGADGGLWRVPDVRLEAALAREGPEAGLQVTASASGSGALTRDGAAVFAEPGARAALEARFAPDGGSVAIERAEVVSSLVELEARGQVTELATRRVAELQGRAALDFAAVTRLLEARGVDEFQFAGREPRAFRFKAPLGGGGATVFAEGEAAGAAHLASARGLGLAAGPADVTLRLEKGRLKAAYEPALNGGRLRLLPEVVSERGATRYSVQPRTRVLEGVRLTQEMVDTLLVHVNPLFEGSRVRDGTVTLDVASGQLVAGLTPEAGLAADLTVTFQSLKLEMGPTLRELLALLKVKERVYSVERLPVRAVVRDGRVHVDPVTMVVEGQPVVFSGWVAFDGAIQYLVEVPLTDRLIGGAGGKLLKGVTVKIPVTGTVDAPRLDTAALTKAIGGLVQQAVGEKAVEKIGTFLEKLQEELKR